MPPACAATVTVQWSPTLSVKGGRYSSSTKTLSICAGDTVAFSWAGSSNNLVETDYHYYHHCAGKAVRAYTSTTSTGAYNLKMTAPGTKYIVSTVAGRCQMGATGGGLRWTCPIPTPRSPSAFSSANCAPSPSAGLRVQIVATKCGGR